MRKDIIEEKFMYVFVFYMKEIILGRRDLIYENVEKFDYYEICNGVGSRENVLMSDMCSCYLIIGNL